MPLGAASSPSDSCPGTSRAGKHVSELVSQLVSWSFEPSLSHRIISGLKTNFSQSPSHSAHKSPNQRILQNLQNQSPSTNFSLIFLSWQQRGSCFNAQYSLSKWASRPGSIKCTVIYQCFKPQDRCFIHFLYHYYYYGLLLHPPHPTPKFAYKQ